MEATKGSGFKEIKVKESSIEKTPKYKEYRKKWTENPAKDIVEDFPIHLDIELNSNCNLKCVMCFQSFAPPKMEYMDEKLYKKLIDEGAANGLRSIKLQYRGEPLLHLKLAESVAYAKSKGVVEVMFNTNGTLLTEKMANKLIDAKLDKIIFSIEGTTPEVYESIRIGGKFNKVLENIKRLQKMKKERGIDYPITRVQMVKLPRFSKKDIQDYIDFWGEIVDHVGMDEYNDWETEMTTGFGKKALICKEFCCSSPWQRLFILADGRITLCCGDHSQRLVLGDAHKVTIKEIWHNKTLQNIRKLHKKGESHKIPICNDCSGRRTIIKLLNQKRL
ncbi:MAG: radical SAM protein [Nanoarchaeota archaeon]|nr:radical SAM protein [DPANN group archaeon]MBL7116684.1 radical SAM protein [Nanoarchaeota archaeon]